MLLVFVQNGKIRKCNNIRYLQNIPPKRTDAAMVTILWHITPTEKHLTGKKDQPDDKVIYAVECITLQHESFYIKALQAMEHHSQKCVYVKEDYAVKEQKYVLSS